MQKTEHSNISVLFLMTALPRKEINRTSAMNSGQQISLKFYLNSMWNKLKTNKQTVEEKLLCMLQFYQTFRYIKPFSFWPYLNEAIT